MNKKVTDMSIDEIDKMIDNLKNGMDEGIADQLKNVLIKERRNRKIDGVIDEKLPIDYEYMKLLKEETNEHFLSRFNIERRNQKIDDILNEEDTDSDAGERFE